MDRLTAWLVVVLTLAMFAGHLAADSPETEARGLSQRLMSPYCPGLLLSDCRSEGARQLRGEIVNRLQSGEPLDVIENDLVRRFGDGIRTIPSFRGLGLVAWAGPLPVGIIGAWLLAHFIRRSPAPDTPGVAEDEFVGTSASMGERIQLELDALD